MRPSSPRFFALAASCALLLFARVGSPAGKDHVRDRVRIAEMPYFTHAPLYIAAEEGYFAEQQIDAEFVPFGLSNSALTAALLSGELDVATGAPSIADFNAIDRGSEIRFVADKGHSSVDGCSFGAFVIRPDLVGEAGRVTAQSLRGARVRSQGYTYFEFLLEKALRTIGLSLSDVDGIPLPAPLVESALKEKRIAMSYLSEPELSLALRQKCAVVWKRFSEVEPAAQFSAMIFGPRLLRRDRDLGIRVLSAYLKGVRRYNEGKTSRNVEILARRLHRDPQVLVDICWVPIRSDGKIVATDWLEFQSWAVARKQMDRVIPLDRLVDTTLTEEACRRLAALERR